MEAENEHCFRGVGRGYWHAIASGLRPTPERFAKSPDGWRLLLEKDTDGHAFQSGGIANASEYKLMVGRYYYRFISTRQYRTRGAESALSGRWWLRNEDVTVLRHLAEKWSESLAVVAGRALSIPSEWGDCAWLVRARLARPMRAWAGIGGAASAGISPANEARVPGNQPVVAGLHGLDPILQLFVPGDIHQAGRTQTSNGDPFRFVDHEQVLH